MKDEPSRATSDLAREAPTKVSKPSKDHLREAVAIADKSERARDRWVQKRTDGFLVFYTSDAWPTRSQAVKNNGCAGIPSWRTSCAASEKAPSGEQAARKRHRDQERASKARFGDTQLIF